MPYARLLDSFRGLNSLSLFQLASKAADTIAMTDEEKHRLTGLLSDLDTLPDIPDDNTNYSAVS